jgi:flagellar biogenesis protein FliO
MAPNEMEVPMTISTNGLVGLLVVIVLILAIIYLAKRV